MTDLQVIYSSAAKPETMGIYFGLKVVGHSCNSVIKHHKISA